MTPENSSNRAPFFTSERERRLWLAVLAAVALIGLTLVMGGTLAAWVQERDRSVVGSLFVAGFGLLCVAVLTQGLQSRPRSIEIGLVLGAGVLLLLAMARLAVPVAERTHLIEYGMVALLVYEALAERKRHGRGVKSPALVAVVATGLLGVADEVVQIVIPSRVFDPIDIFFNVIAAVTVIAVVVVLRWLRRQSPW